VEYFVCQKVAFLDGTLDAGRIAVNKRRNSVIFEGVSTKKSSTEVVAALGVSTLVITFCAKTPRKNAQGDQQFPRKRVISMAQRRMT
jgi:hypothetical protein